MSLFFLFFDLVFGNYIAYQAVPPTVGIGGNKTKAEQYIQALVDFKKSEDFTRFSRFTIMRQKGYTFYRTEAHILCMPGELSKAAVDLAVTRLLQSYYSVFDQSGKLKSTLPKNAYQVGLKCSPALPSEEKKQKKVPSVPVNASFIHLAYTSKFVLNTKDLGQISAKIQLFNKNLCYFPYYIHNKEAAFQKHFRGHSKAPLKLLKKLLDLPSPKLAGELTNEQKNLALDYQEKTCTLLYAIVCPLLTTAPGRFLLAYDKHVCNFVMLFALLDQHTPVEPSFAEDQDFLKRKALFDSIVKDGNLSFQALNYFIEKSCHPYLDLIMGMYILLEKISLKDPFQAAERIIFRSVPDIEKPNILNFFSDFIESPLVSKNLCLDAARFFRQSKSPCALQRLANLIRNYSVHKDENGEEISSLAQRNSVLSRLDEKSIALASTRTDENDVFSTALRIVRSTNNPDDVNKFVDNFIARFFDQRCNKIDIPFNKKWFEMIKSALEGLKCQESLDLWGRTRALYDPEITLTELTAYHDQVSQRMIDGQRSSLVKLLFLDLKWRIREENKKNPKYNEFINPAVHSEILSKSIAPEPDRQAVVALPAAKCKSETEFAEAAQGQNDDDCKKKLTDTCSDKKSDGILVPSLAASATEWSSETDSGTDEETSESTPIGTVNWKNIVQENRRTKNKRSNILDARHMSQPKTETPSWKETWDMLAREQLKSSPISGGEMSKIFDLIKDIKENGKMGHPKTLLGGQYAQCSRRITKKHRLVYSIPTGNELIIHQIYDHYEDT